MTNVLGQGARLPGCGRSERVMLIKLGDRDALHKRYIAAKPYPFARIDGLLDQAFAETVAAAYPSLETALESGRTFKTVNERKKVQITDSRLFPEPVAKLSEALASPEFLADLSYITGIPDLLADAELVGGGIHVTGPGGRLDVHVDFNYMEQRKLHRRINLLLYLNPVWEEQWGGQIQLWDKDVRKCEQAFPPALNRCVIFETSDISFHGVTPVSAAAPFPRLSFATYYYTKEPPPHWNGISHSTIFKARPDERLRKYVLMPTEALQQRLTSGISRIRRGVRKLTGRQPSR